jgi:hypothetical protein
MSRNVLILRIIKQRGYGDKRYRKIIGTIPEHKHGYVCKYVALILFCT